MGSWSAFYIMTDGILAALAAALVAAIAVLIASSLPFSRGAFARVRARLAESRFLKEARRFASDGRPWSVAVVELAGLDRLPLRRRDGAMACLRLYLEGFVEPGEAMRRLRANEFALILRAGEGAPRRLEVLKQDAGLLYAASYPGLIRPRIACCQIDDGAGAGDALRRARRPQAQYGQGAEHLQRTMD